MTPLHSTTAPHDGAGPQQSCYENPKASCIPQCFEEAEPIMCASSCVDDFPTNWASTTCGIEHEAAQRAANEEQMARNMARAVGPTRTSPWRSVSGRTTHVFTRFATRCGLLNRWNLAPTVPVATASPPVPRRT